MLRAYRCKFDVFTQTTSFQSFCIANEVAARLPSRPRRFSISAAPNAVVFSGIQPTGVPHLGNYLGALRQWVRLQDSSPATTKLIFSIVDLHAITIRQDREQLKQWKRESLAILLAAGLDPSRCTIFFQSDVPAHTELMWILSCTASLGYLSRMTQWKSKLALSDDASPLDQMAKSRLKLGLFSYPVLQAADILVHGATHVPVGEDQVQHLEFARECAVNFNSAYGDVLIEPSTLLSPAKRVMSLKNPLVKMSKSHEDPRSRILLTDSPEDIRAKIKLALTDSLPGITYDPEGRPGIANLLELLGHLDAGQRTPASFAADFDGLSMRIFKERTADTIVNSLKEIRERYQGIMASSGTYLSEVAGNGAKEAAENAGHTMVKVRDAVGLS